MKITSDHSNVTIVMTREEADLLQFNLHYNVNYSKISNKRFFKTLIKRMQKACGYSDMPTVDLF